MKKLFFIASVTAMLQSCMFCINHDDCNEEGEVTITDDDKYHRCVHCFWVNESNYAGEISLQEAEQDGYEPCSCNNED